MKVFIVEDDSMTRKALEHQMKTDGYDVHDLLRMEQRCRLIKKRIILIFC